MRRDSRYLGSVLQPIFILYPPELYLQKQRQRQEISSNALEAGSSEKEAEKPRKARKVVVVKLKKPGAKKDGEE